MLGLPFTFVQKLGNKMGNSRVPKLYLMPPIFPEDINETRSSTSAEEEGGQPNFLLQQIVDSRRHFKTGLLQFKAIY